MPNIAPTSIQQQNNVHPSQAREGMEEGLPQLQIMAIQVGMRLVLDLNRLQGLKLWSLGRISSSERHEHDLQVVSELQTGSTFYSSGTTFRSRVRSYRNISSMLAGLQTRGFEQIFLGPPYNQECQIGCKGEH
jgi:hypothetical protein